MTLKMPYKIPILRFGTPYESLDTETLQSHRGPQELAVISQANAGMIRRDRRRLAAAQAKLHELSTGQLLDICAAAGEKFLHATLPMNADGQTQSPQEYVEVLSASSGLPHRLCRANMQKVYTVFAEMPKILRGLTRGIDPSVLDHGFGSQDGISLCYGQTASSLGVVLPSNSPGVNSIWMPAIPLRVPVLLKPGREEPWTPLRIMQAFLAAGCPAEAFGFYPTNHEGSATILEQCDRALLFGDERTTAQYASDPSIQIHGPGRSKILIGEDQIQRWPDFIDVLTDSIASNGGRSCINVSSIFVPAEAANIAQALAERLGPIAPKAFDDPEAELSSFANPKMAEFIESSISQALAQGGGADVAEPLRGGPRAVEQDGAVFLRPTVVHCESTAHPLAKTEFLFPFTSVVQVPQADMLAEMGQSLVVTAITKDEAWMAELMNAPSIDRLNLGPIPTNHVEWDQPHEGNLFEFLYQRRAIQRAMDW